jgi:transposase-like protein
MNQEQLEKSVSHKLSSKGREKRYFSESARKFILKEIEEGIYGFAEAARIYEVSATSLFKWRRKYSLTHEKGIVKVVELASESERRKSLEKLLVDAHKVMGQQTVELAFYKKLVEHLSSHYEFDFKKNINTMSFDGIESILKSGKLKD